MKAYPQQPAEPPSGLPDGIITVAYAPLNPPPIGWEGYATQEVFSPAPLSDYFPVTCPDPNLFPPIGGGMAQCGPYPCTPAYALRYRLYNQQNECVETSTPYIFQGFLIWMSHYVNHPGYGYCASFSMPSDPWFYYPSGWVGNPNLLTYYPNWYWGHSYFNIADQMQEVVAVAARFMIHGEVATTTRKTPSILPILAPLLLGFLGASMLNTSIIGLSSGRRRKQSA